VELITSLSNPKVKQTRSLRQRKGREESKTFLVEGIHPVGAAVEAGFDLVTVFYAPDFLGSLFAHELIERLKYQGVGCYATSGDVFASMADKENPQGILAVARQPRLSLGTLTAKNFPWGIALVAPQDPGNVGAILRTVDAVGASGIILLENSVDAYHPTAVRASMGQSFARQWFRHLSPILSTGHLARIIISMVVLPTLDWITARLIFSTNQSSC